MGKGRAAPRPFEPQALTGLPCTHVTRTPPHTDLSSFTLIILARITGAGTSTPCKQGPFRLQHGCISSSGNNLGRCRWPTDRYLCMSK